MRKIAVFILVAVILSLFAGCAASEETGDPVCDLVVENGQYYIVPKESLPAFTRSDGYYDMEVIALHFDSIEQMKSRLEKGSFDEAELLELSRFEATEDGKIPICDLSDLYVPVTPEAYDCVKVALEGESYFFRLKEENDGPFSYFFFTSKEDFEKEQDRNDRFEELSVWEILTVTEEPERNAKIYTYSEEHGGSNIVYTIETDQKTLVIRELYTKTFGEIPEHIEIYGMQNGKYFKTIIRNLKERPSLEWLSAFGVTGYEG